MSTALSYPAEKTVAIQLTAQGVGAIGVIQISGEAAGAILQTLTASPKVLSVRVSGFMRANIVAPTDGTSEKTKTAAVENIVLDDALIVRVAEQIYELHVHGGTAVMAATLAALQAAGADVISPAAAVENGCFGRGIVGELNLALSDASTMKAVQLLAQQRTHGLTRWSARWLEFLQNTRDSQHLWHLQSAAQWLLTRSNTLSRLLHPARVAIIGAPNVGKSTLANALLGRPVSITSDLAGTTRDWVDARAVFSAGDCAAPVILVDTAGIRETLDELEQESIARTHQQLALADVVIAVFDGAREQREDELSLLTSLGDRPKVIAINKCDVGLPVASALASLPSPIAISAKTHAGLDALMAGTLAQLDLLAVDDVEPFAFTARQRALLNQLCLAQNADAAELLLNRL